MISDELLAVAASELSAAMAESVSPSDHTFSPAFARKMKLLSRRAAHPARQQVLRYAAAILIAAITAFGGLYLLSPTVRAAVNSWVRTTFGSYIQYYSDDTTPPKLEYDYFLPEEFDGYSLVSELDTGFGTEFLYSASDGRLLIFDYTYSTPSAGIFLDPENSQYSTVMVGDCIADLYLALDPSAHSFLVWTDPSTGTIFSIGAAEGKDFLIAVAEKIQKTEKTGN